MRRTPRISAFFDFIIAEREALKRILSEPLDRWALRLTVQAPLRACSLIISLMIRAAPGMARAEALVRLANCAPHPELGLRGDEIPDFSLRDTDERRLRRVLGPRQRPDDVEAAQR
jgi:hypothetical protein